MTTALKTPITAGQTRRSSRFRIYRADPVQYMACGPHSRASEVAWQSRARSQGIILAGLRLGLVIAPSAADLAALVSGSHADETAYGVSTLSQVAGIAAFERGDEWLGRFVAHLKRQRDHAVARLNRIAGVSCHVPGATFVVFPDVSSLGVVVEEIVTALKAQHGVAVGPGSEAFFGPGAAGHLRLSLATSRTILDLGLDRLEAGLGAIRAGSRAQSP